MPKRKFKEQPPESVDELIQRFNEIQDDIAARREAKRVSMARYRAKLRTRPASAYSPEH